MAANAAIGGLCSRDPGASALSFKFLVVGVLLLLLPLALSARWNKDSEDPIASYLLWSLGVWIAVAFLGYGPILRAKTLPDRAFSGLILLWVYCLWHLASTLSSDAMMKRSPKIGFWACLLLMVLYSLSACWGSGYTSASIMQRLASATVHRDTLILSGLTSMIRDYGKASVGVDGLATVNYHFFSCCVFAAVSKLTGAPALQVYSLFHSQIIPPLFLFSLSLFFYKLSPGNRTSFYLVPMFIATMATYLLPQKILDDFIVWNPLLGESYATSLTLLVHGFYFLPLTAEEAARPRGQLSWTRASYLAAWLFCVAFSKISVGFTAAICALLLLFSRYKKTPDLLMKLAVVGAGFFLVTRIGVKQTNLGSSSLDPLYFIRKNALWGWKGFPVFMFVHWLPVWIGVGAVLARERGGFTDRARALLRDRYFTWVLLPACAVGFASFSLTLAGATGFSFSNLPTILALPWIAGMCFGPEIKLRPYFLLLLVSGLLFQWLPRMRATWDKVVLDETPPSRPEMGRDLMAIVRVKSALSASPRCALQVSREWLFKSELAGGSRCWEVPYYFIGILERPLYGSWLRQACRESAEGRTYNYPQGPSPGEESMTTEGLCKAAVSDGFPCVEVLSPSDLKRYDCRRGS